LEVINEPGRKATSTSYMWVYCSGHVSRNIVLYEYTPGRSGENAEKFLGDYHGYIHTDGYAGYHRLEDKAVLVGCWSHMRRKFNDALQGIIPSGVTSKSMATKGYNYCNQLFSLEKRWLKLSPEERLVKRTEEAKPKVLEFFKWIKDNESMILPKSLLGKAFTYAVNQERKLSNYLLDGRLEISNNRAERAVKPFVIGRKNWLFANTPSGAESSAIVYSLVETAKGNDLNPLTYLEYLLETMPNLDKNHIKVDDLLPWSEKLPTKCISKSF
jgi:transposase